MIRLLSIIFIVLSCTNVLEISMENETSSGCPTHSSICLTPVCIHTASEVLLNMDPTIDPCDDFYKFACNGFIKRTILADDEPIQHQINLLGKKIDIKLRSMLEEPLEPEETKSFVMLKTLYRQCMDDEFMENDSLKTAKALINEIGRWPLLEGNSWNEADFEWTKMHHKLRENGLGTADYFSVVVTLDSKNNSRHIILLDAAVVLYSNLLANGLDESAKLYYNFIVDLAVEFGADKEEAKKQIKESMEMSIEIAKISSSAKKSTESFSTYNPMTILELQQKYPRVPWLEYITSIISVPDDPDVVEISSDEVINVMALNHYIKNIEELLYKTDKRIQANYLLSSLLMQLSAFLKKDLRDRHAEFEKIIQGTSNIPTRWSECITGAKSLMGPALSAFYVRKYAPEDAIRNAKELVFDLRTAVNDLIKEVEWMDKDTKDRALEKSKEMIIETGYPLELLDDTIIEDYFSDFEIADNIIETSYKLAKVLMDKNHALLRTPVNKSDWTMLSMLFTTVNAIYMPQINSINPYFNKDAPSYMNFGGLGFIIGHEITHGFDSQGGKFDKNGELSDWWVKHTEEAFMKKAQCFIDQYSSYVVPELNITLNGEFTLAENIADNGGIKEAYLAYEAWVKRNGEELQLPGLNYTTKQMFWISAANVWCSKQRDEYLKMSIDTNNHSPLYFRVIGPFSNSDAFAKDFNCPEGSRMNPEEKCQVW